MIQDDEHIQTLMGLGLTLLQTKTYLTLATLGKADVKTISKTSSVARQDIYRIMPTLQKLGLAEKIIATPTMYKATPIKEGLSILLQNRKEEIAELQKKTSALFNSFHDNNVKMAFQEEDSQFTITSEMSLLVKMHEKKTRKAQTSIDVAVPSKVVERMLFRNLHYLKRTVRRGIKIRLIAQKGEDEPTPRIPQALEKNSSFELKCLYTPTRFGMHIFDRKEVTLCVSEKEILPALWSNSPNVVKLATGYFDNMWNKAKEPQPNPKTRRLLTAKPK